MVDGDFCSVTGGRELPELWVAASFQRTGAISIREFASWTVGKVSVDVLGPDLYNDSNRCSKLYSFHVPVRGNEDNTNETRDVSDEGRQDHVDPGRRYDPCG